MILELTRVLGDFNIVNQNVGRLPAIMKQTLYVLAIIYLLTSCKVDKRIVEKIDFETQYKFSSEIEGEIAKENALRKYQISASDYSIKGDYRNALLQWDLAWGTKERKFAEAQVDSINQKYTKVKAADYIIDQAKINQVIIINEAHHNSFHRVFIKSLLKELYDIGYTNLGLEALSNEEHLDSLQKIRKYPVQKTGYYITDPQFGNLVREAIEIGYTVFPYETNSGEANGKPREIDQARNIQKVIEARPSEKYLIYCGFDHALEGTHDYWERAMAGRLKEFTGIDPLTINQVLYSEKSNSKFNHPLLKALDIKVSTIILDKDNIPLKYKQGEAWTDVAVFHPSTEYVDKRPNWLFKSGNKKVAIELNDSPLEFPVMVLAFKKGENIDLSVPVDIVEVESRSENCSLGLKKGVYVIVVTNGKESFKFEQEADR